MDLKHATENMSHNNFKSCDIVSTISLIITDKYQWVSHQFNRRSYFDSCGKNRDSCLTRLSYDISNYIVCEVNQGKNFEKSQYCTNVHACTTSIHTSLIFLFFLNEVCQFEDMFHYNHLCVHVYTLVFLRDSVKRYRNLKIALQKYCADFSDKPDEI